jgi:transcriptional regulator GlxA family with amidase domain
MKHISILVPDGAAALSCIEGSLKAFTTTNDFLAMRGREPLFKVQLIGTTMDSRVYDGFFRVTPDATITNVNKTDLVVIPAVNGNMKQVITENRQLVEWAKLQHQGGAELASLCMGAFLLAATGLVDGKKCSTHWFAQNDFRKMFPLVNLVGDRIITDDQGIYSSGGANSFWNLLIYLVEKYTDREIAVMLAKYYQIEIDRFSQSAFTMFNGQKAHDDEPIKKAQEFIENNFQDKLSVEQLADLFALGRRSLERRFKKATSNTVVEYIQRVKIEAAKKSFETTRKNVNEVMYDVGYTDTKAFRTTFKKIAGLSPVEYRNRYNKDAVVFI